MSTLKMIGLADIRENPNALRPVDKSGEQYPGLVDSIARNGVLNPILVRECKDPATGETFYGLIDGLHRFTASKDAGLTTIPCHVKAMEDAAVLEAQIIANVQKIETKPIQYTQQLIRLLAQNPLLTLPELATRLSKSTQWLDQRLGLIHVEDSTIKELIDEGKVGLANAYSLAKLPKDEQGSFLDRAMTMSPAEFIPTVNARVKEIKEAARQGRAPKTLDFTPVAHLRKLGDLKSELEAPKMSRELLAQFNVKDPFEAFMLAVRWALHLDPASIEQARVADEARKAKLAEEKEKRKNERQEKQQQEAAAKAASLESLS